METKARTAEEIRGVLIEAVMSDTPSEKIRKMHNSGMLKQILPELNLLYNTPQNCRWHIYNVGVHTEKVLDMVPCCMATRLAALFHDVGKPTARKTDADGTDHFHGHPAISEEVTEGILKKLGFGKTLLAEVLLLIRYHDNRIQPDFDKICRFMECHADMQPDTVEKLIDLQEADVRAHNPDTIGDAAVRYREIRRLFHKIRSGPCCMDDITISANDIMSVQEDLKGDTVILHENDADAALGMILHHLLKKPHDNDRDFLMEYVKTHIRQIKNIGTDRLTGERQDQERAAYRIRERLDRVQREMAALQENMPFQAEKRIGELAETRVLLLSELRKMHTSHTPYLTEKEIREQDRLTISG